MHELCKQCPPSREKGKRIMIYVRKTLLVAGLAVAAAIGCATARQAAQHSAMPQQPAWTSIDSLARLGQYASALTATEGLLAEAAAKGDWRTEFRAWMYKGRFMQRTGTEPKAVLQAMGQRADTAALPLAQLLPSVVAEQWWNLYQQNRWRVLDRTVLAQPSDDPDTWDQATYMRKVIAEYRASLEPADALAAIPVADLAALLEPAEADLRLRPTLLDLLAHRALEVFRNSETRLAEPASGFRLDDPRLFAAPATFAQADLVTKDSSAWEAQAVLLYQRLTTLHVADSEPTALTALTLERLGFMQGNSPLPAKDSLYLQGLIAFRDALTDPEAKAEVELAIAQQHVAQGGRYQRLDPDSTWKDEGRTAAQICEGVIAANPGPFAVKKARALLAALQQPSLDVTAEEAVVPDRAFRIALTWANTPRVWLRIVADEGRADRGYRDQDQLKRLLGLKPLRAWSVALPDDGDHNTHLSELPVDALPLGGYSILVSTAETFANAPVSIASFRATRLAAAARNLGGNTAQVLVMDRESGAPVQGAKAVLSLSGYRDGRWQQRQAGSAITDADGMAQAAWPTDSYGQGRWTITHGADRLELDDRYYGWGHYDDQGDSIRTFLFTDRAIYRPGQPVEFKGIVTVKRGGTTVVKAGWSTRVELRDVHGEKVDSLAVTTDAYGAFHGRFTAPAGTLTGSMTLAETHGSRSIQVEEYKRPTFEVLFPEADSATAGAAPRLNATATVHGLAKSYAGVPLDGATVRWRVTRSARMPWWCGDYWRRFIPWGRATEVANGTATTDTGGKFTVSFLAEADRAVPRQADPSFNFTVEAEVTDLNGETQQGSTGITVGYRSIDIHIGADEGLDRSQADSLQLNVQDLDGHVLDVPLNVRITRLQAPAVPLRERLWERPDRPVLTQEEFRKRFPQDGWAKENDPLTWPKEQTVLERTGWRAQGKKLVLGGIAGWDVGSYLIEASATDAEGHEVKVRKAFTVYDPAVQHTGFVNEPFHVEAVKAQVEPGGKAQLLLSSALPEARVLMEVERGGKLAVRRWFNLKHGQQLVELPVMEADRGGFGVHFIAVERGRPHQRSVAIDVPWSNKELHVEWMRFRDKLLPGANEEWRLKISGPKGNGVTAQLLAGMYDASLDHFVPNTWAMPIWPGYSARLAWEGPAPFGLGRNEHLWYASDMPGDTVRNPPVLRLFDFGLYGGMRFRGARTMAMESAVFAPPAPPSDKMKEAEELDSGLALAENADGDQVGTTATAPSAPDTPQPATRSDFRETAFFLPDLLTDRDGNAVLKFTMPDALTRWKLLGLAHTTDLKTALFTKEVITQKPLMVTPNLPRFLREGDTITVSAKVAVVEGGAISGNATLELFDPFNDKPVDGRFGLKNASLPFSAAPGNSASVAWTLAVPEGLGTVAVRISAKAGNFTDAEQRPLPVLTDRVLVTESLPLPVSKAGTRSFTLEKLKNNTSATLRHQSLKLEFTPNPAWYAVQALPYLMEYPHQCSEQVFSRLYANSLAAHVVDQRPAIKQVFAQWAAKGPGNEGAFLGKLEKNPELKNVLLAETPWVLNAADERECKHRIGLLFDLQRMATERSKALKQLRDAQLADGSWPWFPGMGSSAWVTRVIVSGFGHLEKLGAADLRPDGQSQVMLRNAVQWLDDDLLTGYKRLQKDLTADQLKRYTPGHDVVQYLYARSFFPRWAIAGGTSTAVEFYKGRLKETWLGFGLQEQAMIALALHRMGDQETPQLIMRSLGERATRSEELGMYWKNFNAGWYWWDFPTETHALLIEAFHEVAGDEAAVNELRLYLLKLKQTTDWKTTAATADACYALLLTGDDWLEDAGTPQITVGRVVVVPDKQEAGTGYFTKTWNAEEINPDMGHVTVTTTADRAAWGALYWQYFEQMDKVTAAQSPFSIRKQVMLNEPTEQGPRLVALDKARVLKPGDKLTIRIELRSDRAMDYVHLKDLRASGLEPTETLSGYRWQGGLGWYQSTRDAATDFFFDHLPAGTHVLEYDLRVAQPGDFSNGITTAMCLYAPEFAAHSEGLRVRVGK
ncbi:MAG: MG2 domain-containing protein [Flavobacteriia bacterium]|nr:MG2 domain-containing protein [Flavobacteriia bacterium]